MPKWIVTLFTVGSGASEATLIQVALDSQGHALCKNSEEEKDDKQESGTRGKEAAGTLGKK